VTPAIRTSSVFVPGKLPSHTYNPRKHLRLEERLREYIEETGSILTLSGPTKTGKTVLLESVLENPVWLDGQGIDDLDGFWERVAEELGVFTNFEQSVQGQQQSVVNGNAGLNAGVVSVKGGGSYAIANTSGSKSSISRPVQIVARDALQDSGRALVVDDFHFIDRAIQRQLVRALKPLVLKGVPMIFVSISHKVQEVVTAEPDMTGRVSTLSVDLWSTDDLRVIASKGFGLLNVTDPGGQLATVLAEASFGSPHLMQKFCREICKANGILETAQLESELQAPQSWEEFFSAQVDVASKGRGERLVRGPQERGRERTTWKTTTGQSLDRYGLTMLATANTGPLLSIPIDRIKREIDILTTEGSPQAGQITGALGYLSKIAALSITEPVPVADDAGEAVDESDLDYEPDGQPVLEYVDDGPNSKLHISDPFFAFYLAWGLKEELRRQNKAPGPTE